MPTNTVISLRERLSRLTPSRRAAADQPLPVRTGVTAVDHTLGGGLLRGTVHDIAPADPGSQGAATGFTLALASCALAPSPERAPGHMLYIQQTFAGHEAGELYAPGLARLGLQPRCITLFRARRTQDVLWAMEEALKCSGKHLF